MADRHALVVGIDAYGNGIPQLGSAVKDAQAVADTLSKEHGYAVTSLLDADATVASITQFLSDEIPSELSVDTPFLVYFAGHGVAEGQDGSKGPQGYLILHDAELATPETWFSMDTLRTALNALACRHLLVVLDCCYAGAFRWATASRDIGLVGVQTLYQSVYQRFLEGEAWQALTSASVDQRAADAVAGLANLRGINADGHSPFAAALIAGLAGAADYSSPQFPADGVITATELYQYVSTCLLPAPDQPTTQTPGIWPLRPDNQGEFVFLNPKVKLKVVPDPPLDDSNSPWLGLEAYSAETKELFFGRTDETAELVGRVTAKARKGSLLAVVGASGAGKSSLVQAGLLPALPASGWTVVQSARLAGDPNGALDAAVKALDAAPKRRRRLLLVVDQFEELYTACPDDEARSRFLKALRALIDGAHSPTVVLTLRSDFELRAADEQALKDIWPAARYQVPQFSGDELRQVILGPAQVKAVYYDPAKVADDLFDEISQTPGALPLLSFALTELYRQAQLRRRRSGAADRALTTADYDAIGGVVGALNRRATQLYDDATADEQQAIRLVFLRLVSQEGAGLTSRRAERAELQFGNGDDAEQQCVDRVIQRYVDAGLLVIDGDTVAPAHDALVAQWQQLHDWLKASDSQDLIRAAWSAACAWETHARAPGYLWNNDPRLPQLAAAHQTGDLNALERAFETASTKRKKLRTRRLIAVTATVMAVLLAAMLWAFYQQGVAQSQRDNATSLALSSIAGTQLGSNLDVSLLLSLEAYRASPTLQAENRVTSALEVARRSGIEMIVRGLGVDKPALAFSPDGRMFAVAGAGGTVQLWDRATQTEIGSPLNGHQGPVTGVFFSPDSRMFVTTSRDGGTLQKGESGGTIYRGTAVLWNVRSQTGRRLNSDTRLNAGEDAIAIAFNPDSRMLATSSGGEVLLWDTLTGTRIGAPLDANHGPIVGLAFSPDGRTLAATGVNGWALWRVRTRHLVGYRPGGGDLVAFSRDGRTLALAAAGGSGWSLWDTRTLTLLSTCDLPMQGVSGLFFTPDGRALGVGFTSATTYTSDSPFAGGDVLSPARACLQTASGALPGIGMGEVTGVAFSPVGPAVAVAVQNPAKGIQYKHFGGAFPGGQTGTVRVSGVETVPRPLLIKTLSQSGKICSVGFAAGGSLHAVSCDGTISSWVSNGSQWYPNGGQSGRPEQGPNGPVVALSPNGALTAVVARDGTVQIRDTTGAETGRPLNGDQGSVTQLAFSPDGRVLASAGTDGTVVLWDTVTHLRLGELPEAPGSAGLESLAFSPDGRTLATTGENGTAVLWDLDRAGRHGQTIDTHQGPVGVAFRSDGRTLVTVGAKGATSLWNLRTGAGIGRAQTGSGSAAGASVTLDGGTLATTRGSVVQLSDTRTGKTIGGPVDTGQGLHVRVFFSPNGKAFATTGGADVSVWDTHTGKRIGELPRSLFRERDGPLTRVALSSDARTLVTMTDTGRTVLWDLRTRVGKPLAAKDDLPLDGYPYGDLYFGAFSPDGRTLAAAINLRARTARGRRASQA